MYKLLRVPSKSTSWIPNFVQRPQQEGFCGVKEFDNPNPPHTKPKAHAEEKEMAEDE